MMTVETRPTARIIPFPKKGRLGFAKHMTERQITAHAAEAPVFDSYGSWYHEEAVREAAEQARKL
jgi:hypothetical protein